MVKKLIKDMLPFLLITIVVASLFIWAYRSETSYRQKIDSYIDNGYDIVEIYYYGSFSYCRYAMSEEMLMAYVSGEEEITVYDINSGEAINIETDTIMRLMRLVE